MNTTPDLGTFSQLSDAELRDNTDLPYKRTVVTVLIESTESEMHHTDRLDSIIKGALEQCPTPQAGETITITLDIREFKLTIDRQRHVEPAAERS